MKYLTKAGAKFIKESRTGRQYPRRGRRYRRSVARRVPNPDYPEGSGETEVTSGRTGSTTSKPGINRPHPSTGKPPRTQIMDPDTGKMRYVPVHLPR